MIKQHIEIVRSSIVSLSSMSQKSADGILAVLNKYYDRVGITTVNNLDDLEALVASKPDLVFLGMNFVPSDPILESEGINKVWLSQYLDDHGIAYTGSDQMAHELEVSKPLAKKRVLAAGLNTSRFYVARQNRPISNSSIDLNYPLFVKPTNMGGGQGIDSDSIVYNFAQLITKANSIASNLNSDSLIEEYLPGREFSVALLKGQDSDGYSVMPLELIAPIGSRGERILSSQVKSADSERSIAVTDSLIKAQIEELAIDVFAALGARDYGRIDIRLNDAGIPHFLEANLIPSLIEGYGNFPKACLLNKDLDFEDMLNQIVELGLRRKIATSVDVESFPILSSLEPVLETL